MASPWLGEGMGWVGHLSKFSHSVSSSTPTFLSTANMPGSFQTCRFLKCCFTYGNVTSLCLYIPRWLQRSWRGDDAWTGKLKMHYGRSPECGNREGANNQGRLGPAECLCSAKNLGSLSWWLLRNHSNHVVVQMLSCVRLFVTRWTAAHQASLSPTISWSLPKFMFIALVMPSSHLILWCPLLLLPSIFPSIRDFSNELSVCIRWSKYWSFNFNISPSSEFSGLISLKIDWFDLFALQGTFRSLLQHHSSKASILWRSALYVLTTWTFAGRVIYLLFNTLSRSVITFLLRSKCLLISWLQSPSAVILSPRRGTLSLLPPLPLLFAMKWWGWMPWS